MMLAIRIFAIFVFAFLVLPILVIFPLSFSSGEVLTLPTPGWSLRWYEDFFHSPRWLLATWNSFVIGIATMFLATTLGTLAAFGLHMSEFRGKKIVIATLSLPMVVPTIVIASSLFFGFATVGLTNSRTGLIIAHTIIAAPYVVITVLAAVQTFDNSLLRAAMSLGAGPFTAFVEVVLPMIMPGVIAGAIFAFATSFDELIIAIFLSGPEQLTLPRQMFSGLREMLSPTIAAAAVLMILFSTAMLIVAEVVRARSESIRR
ncbi:ABC transporter permease [Gemmobacter sp. 24YEA27]|uniref:ABC transporter permease n=1 Tax=Gemmobacter sp. 24YEA27 TaxID=3040672 RepID=UPI0024B32E5E|nr:ABC transporter permease [Gemmobacter sp. 24YEA27]